MLFQDRAGNYIKKPANKPIKKRTSVYGLFIKDKSILLVKPNVGERWFIPGGGLEEGETLEDCIKREFQEETGYEVITCHQLNIPPIKSRFYADDIDTFFVTTNYFFRIVTVRKLNNDYPLDREIAKVCWISLEKLSSIEFYKIHLKVLKTIDSW